MKFFLKTIEFSIEKLEKIIIVFFFSKKVFRKKLL